MDSVERQISRFVGGGSSEGGVCDPFPYSSSPIRGSYLSRIIRDRFHQKGSSGDGDKGSIAEGSNRTGASVSRLLQPYVCSSQSHGGWRLIIDLSVLNHYVVKTKFRMETTQSVLRSVRRNNWMISVDLKDAYLQVPIHPQSRRYLGFVAES